MGITLNGYAQCLAPHGLFAFPESNMSATPYTTATLYWQNASPEDTSWEILLIPSLQEPFPPPVNPEVVNGTKLYTVNTQSPFVADSLTYATKYYYYIRTICSPGIKSPWSGAANFGTVMCNPENSCDYTFRMTDTANNGWNGARMEIRQNGIAVTQIGYTFASGAGPVDVSIPLCNNIPFDVYWLNSGSKPQECVLSVLNSFGQTIYTKPAGQGTPGSIVINGIPYCDAPTCNLIPTDVSISQDTNTSGLVIDWSAIATTSWDIYIVPTGSTPPTAETIPTYSYITEKPFTTTNPLLKDTTYDVYIRTNCPSQPSGWSTVMPFTTLANCIKPSNLTVSTASITTESATVSWTNGTPDDTAWEVLLIPGPTPPVAPSENPTVGNGSFLVPTTIGSSMIFDNLTAATLYYYYIRTVCSADSKSKWAGPYIFNTQTCDSDDKCIYKFILTDSGIDGWSGGRMQVRQNGIVVATIGQTITGSGPTSVSIGLCNNVPFDLYWNIEGSAPSEIGVAIQNPFTDIIYTKVPASGTPLEVLYSSVSTCTSPSCPKPTPLAVVADSITQTEAGLSWTETGSATQWEVYVAALGSAPPVNGTPLNSNNPNYHLADINIDYHLTGLLPGTTYIYYVRAICSSSDISNWPILSPKTFTTKPVNDECENAIAIPVNPTKEATLFVSGNTLGATRSIPNTQPICPGNTDDDVWFSFTSTSTTHIITISNIVGGTTDINHALYAGNDCTTIAQLYCSNPNYSIATNLVVGTTYKIRIYTNGGNIGQSATFDLAITTPPAITNDESVNAMPVIVNNSPLCEITTSGSLAGATASAEIGTCQGTEDDDVWFSFVANATLLGIQFTNITGGDLLLGHALYTADLTLLTCSSANQITAQDLSIGQTYIIRVWSTSNVLQDISFDVCIKKKYIPLVINATQTAEQLVTDILTNNPCVDISNVTSYTGTNFGSVNGIGSFTNPNADSGFPASGIVLSTGDINSIPGANTSDLSGGDSQWPGDSTILTNPLDISFNASKLEFDFTSQNTYMSFNFLFASEEYGTYQCSFSDAFAFLLTDLSTNVITNLAVIPNTTIPVSTNTVRDQANNQACNSQNIGYFGKFFGATDTDSAINFNGLTKIMTASSPLLANHVYHIKLAITDAHDPQYDSAVFIQAGNFMTGPAQCTDKIKAIAFIDSNNNGIKEEGETNFTYGSFVSQKNNTGTVNNSSSPIGSYSIYDENPANTYDISYQINLEYQPYFSVGTLNFNDINIPVGSGIQTLYFPITLIQQYNDVTISIIPVSTPRAGTSYSSKIVYKNLGIATASGTITFTKDPLATITTIGQSGTVATADGFTYDFTNLAPYETRSFNVTMNLPPIPGININDIVVNSAIISTPANDISIANNFYSNSQVVVSSYDPNDKMEAHGAKIDISKFNQDDYLYYTIRFQNTGTANAINIRIEDLLDEQLDEQSIRMVSASHDYIMERVGNHVVWKFDYIQLPGAIENDALSNGYLTFRIKVKPGFVIGDIIPNTAAIYFDTNPAIITNTFDSEFVPALDNPYFSTGNISVYPNPANDHIQIIVMNTNENIASIVLYDMLGKAVNTILNVNAKTSSIDVSTLAKGVYMIGITTENKLRQVKKLVIE